MDTWVHYLAAGGGVGITGFIGGALTLYFIFKNKQQDWRTRENAIRTQENTDAINARGQLHEETNKIAASNSDAYRRRIDDLQAENKTLREDMNRELSEMRSAMTTLHKDHLECERDRTMAVAREQALNLKHESEIAALKDEMKRFSSNAVSLEALADTIITKLTTKFSVTQIHQ